MSNFSALIATIQANIKTNGNEEITGAVLQDVLEAMVQALGTEAINNLETALGNEETARQNADGTLQNNIDAEALRAGTAEAGFGGRLDTIEAEIPSAASSSNKLADKAFVTNLTDALQAAVNGIKSNIDNGYVYAGIATPSGTPASGKVFYLAKESGTYTNFGGLVVTQGINILKYNGSDWSQEQLIGIDDEPTAGSDNLVKSGGAEKYSKYITGLSGISQYDIKGALMVELGGCSNDTGADVDNMPWRIRSRVRKFPFPIRVKHNIGFGFRVFYFDDENMTNPQPQEWQNNTSIVQTFDIPANQYFRIVAYWDGHQTQADAITDIVSSELYNNIYFYNSSIYPELHLGSVINSTTGILPNIDSVNKTLNIPGYFMARATENVWYEPTASVTIPLKEQASISSAQMLICNLNTGTFYFKQFNYNLNNVNEIILGSVRLGIDYETGNIKNILSIDFPFEYTVDGVKPYYPVCLKSTITDYAQLIPHLRWSEQYPTRILNNANRIYIGDGGHISLAMVNNSLYQFAVRLYDYDGNNISDTGWLNSISLDVNNVVVNYAEIWFREKDNATLSEATIADIEQYVDSIEIIGYGKVDDPSVSLKLFIENNKNISGNIRNSKVESELFSRYEVGLSGVSQDDIKSALMVELGGCSNDTGADVDNMPWRIRSRVKKFPFPIRVKHNVGFGFRVFYFDDENMTNPQPQEWQNNTSIIQVFDIPANQYFRIVTYWDGHQTQADAITDIVSCELYNNIMVFNKNIIKRCYDYINIIDTYSELVPYLKWTDSIPLRIVSNGDGVPVYKKGVISITMANNSPYQFAILLFNSEKTKVYDSGWYDTLTKEITEEDVQFIQIWFRDRNNSTLNNNTIQDIEQYVSKISIDGLVLVDEAIPSLNLLNKEIQETKTYLRKEILRPIISVSHQGYSVTSQYYGNSRISSFKASAKHGFDWAETDVKFSQDNIPVCSHDATFTDTVTGDVIVIADHTFAELETYNYYGEKIASLDEVVKTCKLEGLNLVIDHTGYIDTDSKWSTVFEIIQKYNMADRMAWSVSYDDVPTAQNVISKILNFYSGSRILITCFAITQDKIDLANSSKTQQNKVSVFCGSDYTTVSDIIACNSQLLNGVTVWVWTVDDPSVYKSYAPYVEAIYSNKISSPMLDLDE